MLRQLQKLQNYIKFRLINSMAEKRSKYPLKPDGTVDFDQLSGWDQRRVLLARKHGLRPSQLTDADMVALIRPMLGGPIPSFHRSDFNGGRVLPRKGGLPDSVNDDHLQERRVRIREGE